MKKNILLCICACSIAWLFMALSVSTKDFNPKFKLIPAEKVKFNSFVDCNMAEAWVGDTFRIFPGKYGEDPLWGYNLKYKI